MAHASHV